MGQIWDKKIRNVEGRRGYNDIYTVSSIIDRFFILIICRVIESGLTRYLTRYQEVVNSKNQVPNQVPVNWKNGKPGSLPGTRNLTRNFWPYLLV